MKPEGWGPWNVRAVNALVHLPSGLELRLGIRTPDGTEHWELRWRQMERLGPLLERDLDGEHRRMGKVRLRLAGATFSYGFLGAGPYLSAGLSPLDDTARQCKLLVRLWHPWGDLDNPAGRYPQQGEAAVISASHFEDVLMRSWFQRLVHGNEDPIERHGLTPGGPVLELSVADNLSVRVNAAGEYPEDMDDTLQGASGEAAVQPDLSFDTEKLQPDQELEEILWRGVAWNTIWHPRKKMLMTPVSRDWCVDENNFGDYVLFPWDTFFCALLAARRDEELAYANVRAVLGEMTERGMLPNVGGGAGQTKDRSQPPVGGYCVWKLYEQFGNDAFLAEVYPQLARWHAFWMKYRDGNGDGLLEWGSDPIPAPVDWWKPHTQQAAKWESGLDNSPMYEDIPFNEEANTLELADIGLTCLYAADAEALAKMADALGKPDEAGRYREEYEALKVRINDLMWDEERGLYVNRHWDGRFANRYSPTSFYPLLAGVATPERAERSVREHLMNPDEFWGEWVIPSIARTDPNFHVQKYWQGRVWPPFNFLVYEGLRRYGLDDAADQLAEKSAALLLKEWREEGHIHENYNALTADGDDVDPADPEGSSDPIYTWGGLLALIALDKKKV